MFSDQDKFVVFVSGLKIGGHGTNPLDLQLLLDHLTGHIGEEQVLSCFLAEFYLMPTSFITQLRLLSFLVMVL